MPSVSEALVRMDRELALARREQCAIVKLIHGYGSSGAGGDIRIAVQKRLYEMVQRREIRSCIFGEDWARSNDATWRLVQARPELKKDPHLGRKNPGITVVVL